MTEGTGYVIDPNGDARRALHDVVAAQGPQALSDPAIMERVCRDRLAGLPGESALIGSAVRADVPARLREQIPRLGNYGAIRSVATTLAGTHELDNAAAVWVVREYARAMGLIAPGPIGPGPGAWGRADPGCRRRRREGARRDGIRTDRGCSTATRSGWPRRSRWWRGTWGSRRWRT